MVSFKDIKPRLTLIRGKTPNYPRSYNRYIGLHGEHSLLSVPHHSIDAILKEGKFQDLMGTPIVLEKEFVDKFPSFINLRGLLDLKDMQFIVYDYITPNGNLTYKERYKNLTNLFLPYKYRDIPIKFRGEHIELGNILNLMRLEDSFELVNEQYRKCGKVYIIDKQGNVNRYYNP